MEHTNTPWTQPIAGLQSDTMAYSEHLTEGYNKKITSREGSDNFKYVEAPNASRMLGDIAGLRVLDLACGSGRFSRWLKTFKHAEEVVGIDMSEDMVGQARETENKEPLNIRYHVADASKPVSADIGTFDVCFAGYLLHYATDRQMLRGFLQNIHRWLKDGGIFVTLNQNPDDVQNCPEMIQYGFTMTFGRLPPKEGDFINFKCFEDEHYLCEFDNYFFKKETYEQMFIEVGFKNFSCEPYKIEATGEKWNLWKQRRPNSVMRAYK